MAVGHDVLSGGLFNEMDDFDGDFE